MILCLTLVASTAFADEPINQTLLTGVAIDGYDVVAYYTEGKALEGSKEHQLEWNGAKWRFASEASKSLFAKEPKKYAPQYGGFCAFGVSRGYAVGIDPEAWTIVDQKLYLNYDKKVQAEWLKDVPGYISKANESWPKIVAEKTK